MVKKYAVAGFTNEKDETVEIVPSNWLIGNETCLWPTAKDANKTKIKSMIKECVEPSLSWLTFSVRIFGYSNSFIRASEKTELARSFSSVGSDSSDDADEILTERINSNKRASNVPNRYRDSSDEENCLPPGKKRGTKTSKELRSIKTKYTIPEPPKACESPQSDKEVCVTPSSSFSRRNQNSEQQRMSLLDVTPSSSRNLDPVQADTNLKPLLEKVLKNLVEIKHEQKEMKREIRKLREKIEMKTVIENPEAAAAISGIVESGHEFLNLPVSSVEQLHVLEDEITKDITKATSLDRFLCRGGGFANANSLTLLIMKRLLSRDVAMLYSLEGRQKKLKFSDLNLFNVVIASVKIKFDDAVTAMLSSRIGKALAGSFDWDGKRRDRVKKEANDTGINTGLPITF